MAQLGFEAGSARLSPLASQAPAMDRVSILWSEPSLAGSLPLKHLESSSGETIGSWTALCNMMHKLKQIGKDGRGNGPENRGQS